MIDPQARALSLWSLSLSKGRKGHDCYGEGLSIAIFSRDQN